MPDGRIEWLMQDFGGDLEVVPPGPSWQQHAACLGEPVDLFFPDKGESTTAAKAICADCPVADSCLDWALAEGFDVGVFGGLSPTARKAAQRDAA